MKILKCDKTGHTTIETDLDTAWRDLVKQGYAMFLNDEKITEMPALDANVEVLALAPLVGG